MQLYSPSHNCILSFGTWGNHWWWRWLFFPLSSGIIFFKGLTSLYYRLFYDSGMGIFQWANFYSQPFLVCLSFVISISKLILEVPTKRQIPFPFIWAPEAHMQEGRTPPREHEGCCYRSMSMEFVPPSHVSKTLTHLTVMDCNCFHSVKFGIPLLQV